MKLKRFLVVLSAFLVLCCVCCIRYSKNASAYYVGQDISSELTISRTGNYYHDEWDCSLGSCWDMSFRFDDGRSWDLVEQWHCISPGVWAGPSPVRSRSAEIESINSAGVATVKVIAYGQSGQQNVQGKVTFQATTTATETVTVNYSGSSKASVSGAGSWEITSGTYGLPKTTDTANLAFDFIKNFSIDPSSKSSWLPSGYQDVANFGNASGTTDTNQSIGLGETKKFCQKRTLSPTRASYVYTVTYLGSTAISHVLNPGQPSTSGSTTVESCVTVYREAEAYVGLTTKIFSNVTQDVTNPSSNQSEESTINKDSTSSSIAIGDRDKIFMDSSANGSTKKATISFDYTLTRGDPNSTYDVNRGLTANYTLNGADGSVDLDYPSGSKSVSDKYTLCNGSGSGCDEVIPLGTYDKQICRTFTANSTYLFKYDSITSSIPLTSVACAHVYRPYNFDLTPSVSSDNTEVSYIGGEVDVHIKVDNNTNSGQEGTHSYSPEETQVKVVRFIIDKSTSSSDVDGKLSGETTNSGDICTFYTNKIGGKIKTDSCTDLTSKLTNNGVVSEGIAHSGFTQDITDTIPTSYEVGDKVCYAVAVNYANSSYINNGNGSGYGSASLAANKWIISNASCRTTAKRPTFQVLGGSVFAEGSVRGAVTKALAGSSYEAFGSWVDFGIISNSEVTKVASGASLAKGNSLSGSDSSVDFCTYSPLTVANRDCNNGGENLGDAKISINTTTLNTLLNRYANNAIAKKISRSSIDISSDYTTFSDKYFSVAGDGKYRYTYINGNSTISASSALPKGTTQVIYATGKITIDGNLTYQDAGLETIDDIPQYIIIADGGIAINGGVTKVDAWLVTPNSTVNTCSDKEIGTVTLSGDVCENELEVNGPVFANNLLLYRTHGANPTDPSEPAEVFDVSVATYLWAHNEAIADSNQANTVYSRRMAPRE